MPIKPIKRLTPIQIQALVEARDLGCLRLCKHLHYGVGGFATKVTIYCLIRDGFLEPTERSHKYQITESGLQRLVKRGK